MADRAPKGPSKVEVIKEQSQFLREPLATELKQDTTHFTEAAVQILKFHGSYQQDNRDLRQERRAAGLERDYSVMLRTRVPGGVVPPQLYLALDRLADQYGNQTLRITTRQTFQMHGILKQDLKTVIAAIVAEMGSTLATCGDINRNVMASPAPFKTRPAYVYAHDYAHKLADLLAPHTGAYYELWIDDEQVPLPEDAEVQSARAQRLENIHIPGSPEPLYSTHYLPRKFKCAITVPEENSVDIYSQDIGLMVVTSDSGKLLGFNVVVGGGMGRTHNKAETFPLLAQPLAFVPTEDIFTVVQAILAVQRDHGNRSDRRQARMKYLVHRWGIKKFRQQVEHYLGQKLKRFRKLDPVQPRPDMGYLGWHPQGDGRLFLGLSIVNGRVHDTPTLKLKAALKEITERFALTMRLTPSQDLLLVDVDPNSRAEIDAILQRHGVVPADQLSPLLRASMACPALPTCGLAITESERALPGMIESLDQVLRDLDLPQESFVIRMTGCPNGCARPYLAEVGLVGVVPGCYQLWVGGSPRGERLAEVLLEKVSHQDLITVLKSLLLAYKQERFSQERFGDYCHRIGLATLRSYLPLAILSQSTVEASEEEV